MRAWSGDQQPRSTVGLPSVVRGFGAVRAGFRHHRSHGLMASLPQQTQNQRSLVTRLVNAARQQAASLATRIAGLNPAHIPAMQSSMGN